MSSIWKYINVWMCCSSDLSVDLTVYAFLKTRWKNPGNGCMLPLRSPLSRWPASRNTRRTELLMGADEGRYVGRSTFAASLNKLTSRAWQAINAMKQSGN